MPVPTNLFRRVKRMARRLDESDDDGANEGVSRATSASPAPAGVSRATTPAGPAAPVAAPASPAAASVPASTASLPMAVAVEYVPRNADNAAMYMELDRVEARFKALDGRLAELEETNRVLTSNEAVYQIAYAQVEARLREKDEKHAELIKCMEARHAEALKAQEEIARLKEASYLATIKENADRFMQLTKEKDDKYNDMFNANYDLARAKDEIIETLHIAKRSRQVRRPE